MRPVPTNRWGSRLRCLGCRAGYEGRRHCLTRPTSVHSTVAPVFDHPTTAPVCDDPSKQRFQPQEGRFDKAKQCRQNFDKNYSNSEFFRSGSPSYR